MRGFDHLCGHVWGIVLSQGAGAIGRAHAYHIVIPLPELGQDLLDHKTLARDGTGVQPRLLSDLQRVIG